MRFTNSERNNRRRDCCYTVYSSFFPLLSHLNYHTFSFYHSHLIFSPFAKKIFTFIFIWWVTSCLAPSSPSSCFSMTSDSSLPSHLPLLIISSSSSLFQSDETSQPSIREPINLPVFPSSSSSLCLFSLPWKLFPSPLCSHRDASPCLLRCIRVNAEAKFISTCAEIADTVQIAALWTEALHSADGSGFSAPVQSQGALSFTNALWVTI